MLTHLRQVLLLAAVAATVAYTTCGCATYVNGKTQKVTFESDPPGATVRYQGNVLGKTPFTTTLNRKNNGIFGVSVYEFQKDGYQCKTVNTGLDGYSKFSIGLAMEGLIPIAGQIGLLVDFNNGTLWSLNDPFRASLYPVDAPVTTPQSPTPLLAADTVTQKLKQLKELKDNGTLTEEEYNAKRKELIEKL